MGEPLKDPLKPFGPSQHYGIEGLKEGPPFYREATVSRTAEVVLSSCPVLVLTFLFFAATATFYFAAFIRK